MPRGEVQARTVLRNLDGVARLQRLCERFGVKPTYLLAWPVIGATDLFDGLGARAELGTYLQPWATPPFEASEDRLSAFAVGTLGSAAAAAKIADLTEAFTARFGYAPRCHRAAKAGLTGAALQALERLEYAVDCTATPFLDQRGRGGCDWRMAPEVPYFPDRQRPTLRGASPVLEVPRTVGWSAAVPDVIARGAARAPDRVLRWMRPGLSIRRLNPHAHDIDALRDLAALLIDRGLPVLNLSIRSWELVPGTSQRGGDAATFEAYFERLESLLRYLVDQLRLTPRTLTEFARWYLNETAYC
jgi:hypothetical protein